MRFLVSSKVKDASILFTLEGESLHEQRIVKLNGHTATVEVKLKSEALVPNFYAAVSTLHSGRMYQRQKSIAVDPTHRFFTVEITADKEKYRPREKATFTILAKDHAGRPVQADVALGIVDESIYALQSEYAADIRRFFVRRRWNRVRTDTSLRFYDWGRMRAEDKEELEETADAGESIGIGGGAGGARAGRAAAPAAKKALASKLADTEVRGKFADTMFWTGRPCAPTSRGARRSPSTRSPTTSRPGA